MWQATSSVSSGRGRGRWRGPMGASALFHCRGWHSWTSPSAAEQGRSKYHFTFGSIFTATFTISWLSRKLHHCEKFSFQFNSLWAFPIRKSFLPFKFSHYSTENRAEGFLPNKFLYNPHIVTDQFIVYLKISVPQVSFKVLSRKLQSPDTIFYRRPAQRHCFRYEGKHFII